jgi:hypothetical protein
VACGVRLKIEPAPIPRLVELACAWLGEHEGKNRLLSPARRAARWRDIVATMPKVDHVIDNSREALYDPPRGL